MTDIKDNKDVVAIEYVRNPLSNRFIKINGTNWRRLCKGGVILRSDRGDDAILRTDQIPYLSDKQKLERSIKNREKKQAIAKDREAKDREALETAKQKEFEKDLAELIRLEMLCPSDSSESDSSDSESDVE